MTTPSPADCQQVAPGWRAFDLAPDDIADLIHRFASYIRPGAPDECWPWDGPVFPATGYGKISRSSKARQPHLLAHRVAYVAFTGQTLTGNLTIDHLCNNKICVNPDHLEPVTLRENVRRKNERLGHAIGASSRPRGVSRQRTTPVVDDEDRLNRQRVRSLEYYYKHRDQILAARRSEPRDTTRETCPDCAKVLRHDGMRRHRKRMHGLV